MATINICEAIDLGTFSMCDVQIPSIEGVVELCHAVSNHTCERQDGDFGPLLRGVWYFDQGGNTYKFTAV